MRKEKRENGFAWEEIGNGAPVLLLHGMPGSCTSWDPQFEAFSAKHRVAAWDMPGYGRSDHRVELDTPALMADFLADRMRGEMGLGPCHVVGLSLGGMIAMELALAHPDLVRSLVLLDSSPMFGLDGGSDAGEFVASVRQPLTEGTSVAELCRVILKDLVGSGFEGDAFEAGLAAMARATPEGLVQAATLIGNHNALGRLENITAPTLVMAGAQDTATPPAYSKVIAERIPGAILDEIPESGHLSNLENPEFVNTRIAAFLATV